MAWVWPAPDMKWVSTLINLEFCPFESQIHSNTYQINIVLRPCTSNKCDKIGEGGAGRGRAGRGKGGGEKKEKEEKRYNHIF